MLDKLKILIQNKIQELSINNSLNNNIEILEEIKKDYNKLLDIDLNIIKEILNNLDNLTEEEKEVVYKFISSIKTLLECNKYKNTTFKISEEQLKYIDILINKVKEQIKINKSKEEISIYKELLDKLNNNEFITETSIIDNLLKENNISIEERKQILIELIKYNKNVYENKKLDKKTLDENDLINIFNKYNYDYSKLSNYLKEKLLINGNINQIEEVFNALKELKFPKINIERDGIKLVTILLNCDRKTLEEIVEFTKENGLNTTDLLQIIPVLIKQNNHKKNKNYNETNSNTETLIMNGKSTDYIKNIEFLKNIGFDIRYIFNKCKELLLMKNERLKNNFKLFNEYGFKLEQDHLGNLTHPALSCMLSSNFCEIVDQFIEICPKGYEYIKNNMSRLISFPDPKNIVFYNIYASYFESDEYGNDLTPEGPFTRGAKFNLRGEITRYAGSGYKNVPYRGITEENKQEKTFTIDPPIENKEIFYSIIENKELKNINYSKVKELDEYIDESNHLRYNFNGVIISRLKVERIYNLLKQENVSDLEDSLLYSILYNTIINEEDYLKVKNIIKSRSK